MRPKRVRRSIATLVMAFVTALSGATFVTAPAAYAAGLSNPSGTLTVKVADIHHLKVKVSNGTTAQGTECHKSRNIFNWTRLAYKTALSKADKGYRLGYMGPDFYDCSGLVLSSYNGIWHFPDIDTNSVRTAEQIYDWARRHTSPAKKYANRVPPSDVKVGDLAFYRDTIESPRSVTHVAFWAGNNTLYDALSPTAGIGFHANSSWWTSRLVAVYRILGVSTD